MKKSVNKGSVICLIVMGLFCICWSSAFAENGYQNNRQWTAWEPLANPSGKQVQGFLVAQGSTQKKSGNYNVNTSSGSARSGNYNVNTSSGSARSGNYNVHKSTGSSTSGNYRSDSHLYDRKTWADPSQGNSRRSTDYTRQQKASEQRVRSSPKYRVHLPNLHGAYGQGK